MTSKAMTPSQRALKTARWATTMTRWSIRHATAGKRAGTKAVKAWQLIGFPGARGGESRGIVDLLAIRRDHRHDLGGVLRSGDLFEMMLVQIKGGSAPWPTEDDILRLREVRRHYRAKHIVLAAWIKGKEPTLYVLGRGSKWRETSAVALFGSASRLVRAVR